MVLAFSKRLKNKISVPIKFIIKFSMHSTLIIHFIWQSFFTKDRIHLKN